MLAVQSILYCLTSLPSISDDLRQAGSQATRECHTIRGLGDRMKDYYGGY